MESSNAAEKFLQVAERLSLTTGAQASLATFAETPALKDASEAKIPSVDAVNYLFDGRRPAGMIVDQGVVCETSLIRPVRIHDIYLAVTITVAGKGNLPISAKRWRLCEACHRREEN
jgi:hypothetical protein